MKKEKIITVHLNKNNQYDDKQIESKLEELKELVRASNSEFIGSIIQNSKEINSKYYIGSGKVEEIKEMAENLEADAIVFDNELTGSQMKNLEEIINKKIIDRTGLILDIFATRAKTKESKLQVKLAQLEYRLPRLVGYRNYLSREGAGVGTRGPGEQKLEIDRRSIQKEINSIKNKLLDIDKKRSVERNKRINSSIPIISLIGYSNAGKSTILNQLTENYSENNKKVYSDDMLFATLDTSARSIKLKNDRNVIISDTVGFITNLPTKLVQSFKSTLEEINDSDLILIVVDSSNHDHDMQINATQEILNEMDLRNKNIAYIFNKIDRNPEFKYYGNIKNEIYISAKNPEDIDRLVEYIENILYKDYILYKVHVSYSNYEKIRNLVPISIKDSEEYLDDGINTFIYTMKDDIEKYGKYLISYEERI